MADLRLSHIYKVYDSGQKAVKAVNDFSIDIKDKEFIVFVGPSGCGKSTTLRMIAGLEKITAGDLFIGDTLVNDVEPKDRDIAMVFQNYALYPHMTVYENLAFGLRNRHVPEDVIKEKVLEAAKILDIEEYLDRKPKAMSGGQRQRVALGRAIVRDPKVFLLDEPLSNLDAKLRAQMRTEITKLHKKLKTTFIYVTHDQVEAMTMGSRIVVMKLGYTQQIDTPMNLYNHPANKFVAGFIGTPQMNFFDVTLKRNKDKVVVKFADGTSTLELPYEKVSKINDDYLKGNKKVILGARPEHISLSDKKGGMKVEVSVVEHLGNETIIYGSLGNTASAEVEIPVVVKVADNLEIDNNATIYITISLEKLHFFDGETENSIKKEIPDNSKFGVTVKAGEMDLLGIKVALPKALVSALDKKTGLDVEILPSSIVTGKSFALPVAKVEKIGDQYLAHLEIGDRYLFALVDSKVKEGSTYSFDFKFETLRFLSKGEVVVEPIVDNVELLGKFEKVERKENKVRVIDFYYVVNGEKILAPQDKGYKINSIEGNKCYKETFKYVVDRKNITLDAETGVPAKVTRVLDYGNRKFAEVDLEGQLVLVNVDDKFDASEIRLVIKGEDLLVYNSEIDMMIC